MRTVRYGESVKAVLSGAATTTNPTYVIDSADENTGATSTASGSLTGATAVTLLTTTLNPKRVRGLSICNVDTAAVTLTLSFVDSAETSKTMTSQVLQVGDTLIMEESGRMYVLDSSGQIKQSGVSTAVEPHAIPVHEWRKTDGVTINPVTAATTNFGVVYGTDGTDFPHLETIDGKNTTTAVVSRCVVKLPSNYVAGSAVTLRARCGMKTTVASNSAATTIDFNVYSNAGTANTGSADLCETAAQSINSLTAANYDFVITPTGLVAGQDLHVKMTLTVTDSATATAVIGTVNHVELRPVVSR